LAGRGEHQNHALNVSPAQHRVERQRKNSPCGVPVAVTGRPGANTSLSIAQEMVSPRRHAGGLETSATRRSRHSDNRHL
jgi:hypothetical protein